MTLGIFFSTLLVAITLTGCKSRPDTVSAGAIAVPFPTKDDVMLVNGRSVSISEFTAIRNQYEKEPLESVFWMTSAALALINDAKLRGITLTLDHGLLLARFAHEKVTEKEVEGALRSYWKDSNSLPTSKDFRSHAEGVLARSVVQRNAHVLAEFR